MCAPTDATCLTASAYNSSCSNIQSYLRVFPNGVHAGESIEILAAVRQAALARRQAALAEAAKAQAEAARAEQQTAAREQREAEARERAEAAKETARRRQSVPPFAA
jgi:sRNA-binding protein